MTTTAPTIQGTDAWSMRVASAPNANAPATGSSANRIPASQSLR